jgi:demethylmenaquinone methyltransferase/2-methoxy-6-polyprenyl-1,4-benzoquinol methylase
VLKNIPVFFHFEYSGDVMNKKTPNSIDSLLSDPALKRSYNREMFSVIAPKYSLVTRILSWGQDQRWKDHLVSKLNISPGAFLLDIACGTGDITFKLSNRFPNCKIIGIDLTKRMLEIARSRTHHSNVTFSIQDMNSLALQDECADLITGGYMLRNAPDLRSTLLECHRVLKTGATAAFLDFSKPKAATLQKIEIFILKIWGALWGKLFHGNAALYTYIADSLEKFPDRITLQQMAQNCGLRLCYTKKFFLGFAELMIFKKITI